MIYELTHVVYQTQAEIYPNFSGMGVLEQNEGFCGDFSPL